MDDSGFQSVMKEGLYAMLVCFFGSEITVSCVCVRIITDTV